MFRHSLFAPATALALVFAAAPAFAQTMTPGEAWQQMESILDQLDMEISATSRADTADAAVASGVEIRTDDGPRALVISMDTLQVTGADGHITLTPAATFDVAIPVSRRVTRHVQVSHDGSFSGMLDRENAALDLDFPTLRALLLPQVGEKGAPATGGPEMDVTFSGLDASIRAAREGSAEFTLDAQQISYDVTYPDPSGPSTNMVTQDGQMDGIHLGFSGTELDMLSDDDGMLRRAFDAGFAASFEMTAASSSQTSSQMLEGLPLQMVSEGGSSNLRAEVVDGRVDITGDAGTLAISGSYGPIQGGATLGGMALNFGLPLVATPDDQPFRYMISLRDLVPAPELLAMINASQFAGDAVTVTLDLGAQGRLTQELGPDMADSDVPPFDISSASLNDLRVSVGDSALTGSGAVELIGGLLSQIGRPMPEANGDFTFDLVGGERLLTRLQSMGLIPQDQLFFVRMMMNGLSRPVGDDHLQSEVAIRPGGVVTVNGAPLPF